MVLTKAQATTQIPGKHKRLLDAAIVNIDSHLERYSGSPIDIPSNILIPPGVVSEKDREILLQDLMNAYTTGGWHPIETTENGIPVLRLS